MDKLTRQQRSYCMSRVRNKNTGLEKTFRRHLKSLGITGYRFHSGITGRPDIYFPRHKVAVFIDGCFWHGCRHCNSYPKTNSKFWAKKIERNKKRDRSVTNGLRKDGIKVIRFWGHDIKQDPEICLKKLYMILPALPATLA